MFLKSGKVEIVFLNYLLRIQKCIDNIVIANHLEMQPRSESCEVRSQSMSSARSLNSVSTSQEEVV